MCFNSPVDQHYARYPEQLFGRTSEVVPLHVDNPYVLRDHLLCAANEVPLGFDFPFDDRDLWGERYAETIQHLLSTSGDPGCPIQGQSKLVKKPNCHEGGRSDVMYVLHPSVTHPEREVNIRSCDPATFSVVLERHSSTSQLITRSDAPVLGSVGYSRAFFELFEGAIYLHQGKQFLITNLCFSSLTASCIPVKVAYYTSAQNDFNVDVVRQLDGGDAHGFGILRVRSNVYGFRKVFREGRGKSRSVWGGECSLPQLEYETCGLWINIPVELKQFLGARLQGAVHAANHALLMASGVCTKVDTADIDTEHFDDLRFTMRRVSEDTSGGLKDPHEHTISENAPSQLTSHLTSKVSASRLLLYDCKPGGTGACEAIYGDLKSTKERPSQTLLRSSAAMLRDCLCHEGCPSCLYSPSCSTHNVSFDKAGAVFLLERLMTLLMHDSPLSGKQMSEGFCEKSAGLTAELNTRRVNVSDALEPARKRHFVIRKDWNETNPQFISSGA